MQTLSFTAIVKAGRIADDSDFLHTIQGLTKSQATTIGSWLSIATGDDIHLAYINSVENEHEIAHIKVNYSEQVARLDRIRISAGKLVQSNQKIG
jgi:hypothetical protein